MKLSFAAYGIIFSNLFFIGLIFLFDLNLAEIVLSYIFQSFIISFFVLSRLLLVKGKMLVSKRSIEGVSFASGNTIEVNESKMFVFFAMLFSLIFFHLFYLFFSFALFFRPGSQFDMINLDFGLIFVGVLLFLLSEALRFYELYSSGRKIDPEKIRKALGVSILPVHLSIIVLFVFFLFNLPKVGIVVLLLLKTFFEVNNSK